MEKKIQSDSSISTVFGLGIDLAEAHRFRSLLKLKKERLLLNIFSREEYSYCISYKDAATHFAGTFAAKEAVQKAIGDFSTKLNLLEVRRTAEGSPQIWINNVYQDSIIVSITHSRTAACAVAIKQKK